MQPVSHQPRSVILIQLDIITQCDTRLSVVSLLHAVACKAAPDSGPCFGLSQRYFYNSSSMSCELFQYGGCMGNQNNFESERECLQRCRTEGEEWQTNTQYLHARWLYGDDSSKLHGRFILSVQYFIVFGMGSKMHVFVPTNVATGMRSLSGFPLKLYCQYISF